MEPEVLERLGVRAIRKGVRFTPRTHPAHAEQAAELDSFLRGMHEHGVTVLLEIGEGENDEPLGRPRPHLDDEGVMTVGKSDHVWLPHEDGAYKGFVKRLAVGYGWPEGPVTGFMLWNEPWEGQSISGWQADIPRYRTLYRLMGEAVFEAREEAGVDVLVGGADSDSNTWDKLFPEGLDASSFWPEFLDFCSLHYMGLNPPVLNRAWRQREHHRGRVKIWDTESWVANTDDRFAGVIASLRAAGYDRTLGVKDTYVNTHRRDRGRAVKPIAEGEQKAARELPVQSWALSAAVAAVQHFIGERPFREILFRNGLPWVYVFDGYEGRQDDGTVVVLGDLGALFSPTEVMFHNVRSLDEAAREQRLREDLEALPEGPAERAGLQEQIDAYVPWTGATMTLQASENDYRLYDFYGNEVPLEGGEIVIPLDSRGFFLRANAEAPGSFDRMIAATRQASIQGIEPLDLRAHDMLSPVGEDATLRLTVTNVLNRPVEAALHLTLEGVGVEGPASLSLPAQATVELTYRVTGPANPQNLYPLTVIAETRNAGTARLEDVMRVNRIGRRTVEVDADLGDWRGALPQTIAASGAGERSMTEAAWLPFVDVDAGGAGGRSTAFLGHDDENFYFAARIADDTPHAGSPRFEERDDDAYFYPEVAYEVDPGKTFQTQTRALLPTHRVFGFVRPDGSGVNPTVWQDTGGSMALRLRLPNEPVRVSFCLLGGLYDVVIRDAASGQELAERRTSAFLKDGGVATYELSGDVRAEIVPRRRVLWRHRGLYGVFIDPAAGGEGTPAAGGGPERAQFLGWGDRPETDWRGNLGTLGHLLPGLDFVLPEGASAEFLDERELVPNRWPAGVRRFSYRKPPATPFGSMPDYDSVQIAFNTIPLGDDLEWLTHLPGRMPGFLPGARCTDRQYALNRVAPEFGGGTEVWRLQAPGMPSKHFFPRQPSHPLGGPVRDATLAMDHRDGVRVVELAIPWSEMPEVRAAVDAGRTVKFSYRVNHDTGGPTLELAMNRSASRSGARSFLPDWKDHWANQIEFAFEDAPPAPDAE